MHLAQVRSQSIKYNIYINMLTFVNKCKKIIIITLTIELPNHMVLLERTVTGGSDSVSLAAAVGVLDSQV